MKKHNNRTKFTDVISTLAFSVVVSFVLSAVVSFTSSFILPDESAGGAKMDSQVRASQQVKNNGQPS